MRMYRKKTHNKEGKGKERERCATTSCWWQGEDPPNEIGVTLNVASGNQREGRKNPGPEKVKAANNEPIWPQEKRKRTTGRTAGVRTTPEKRGD